MSAKICLQIQRFAKMPLPTLLVKGNLIPLDKKDQQELNKHVPVDYVLQHIKNDYMNPSAIDTRMLILKSKTGSGKSTTIPPVLYRDFIKPSSSDKRAGIICTQPRILTATEIPKGVAKDSFYVPLKMGDNIGYQTKAYTRKPVEKGIIYAVAQVLTAQFKILTDKEIMDKYAFIVIDEVHEESIELDLLLYLIKVFMIRNKGARDLPYIILMSATIDP